MKFITKSFLLALFSLFLVSVSHAGVYQDKLNTCLDTATTEQDRKDLMEWMFFSIASHPDISKFSNISSTDQERADKKVAKLFQNIFINKCNSEIKEVVRNEGTNALENSFEYLGKIASNGLLLNPKVNERVTYFAKYLDNEKFENAFK
jgi:hypothetical protein